jgi:hypothetical protein
MPREYGLDPYGIVARGNSMYGGTTGGFGGMGLSPTFKGGMPGIKFRTAFAEGGYADGGMIADPLQYTPQVMPQFTQEVMPQITTEDLMALAANYGVSSYNPTMAYGGDYGIKPYPMENERVYTMGNPMMDAYTQNRGYPTQQPLQPMMKTPMQPMQDLRQMMQDRRQMRQDQRQMMRGPQQDMQGDPMQGGQMMNRPFAVRGR